MAAIVRPTWGERVHDWSLGGINWQDPEEGGLECLNHVSFLHRWVELGIGLAVTGLSLWIGLHWQGQRGSPLPLVPRDQNERPLSPSTPKMVLLVAFTLIFGIEVGFKFRTRQIVFLLFPCHVTSMFWIYVLATPPTRTNVFLYQLIQHYTYGTLFGIFFPIDEILKLPFEREAYWLQHYSLVIIPIYMIFFERDDYPPAPKWDLSWIFTAYSAGIFWFFVVMQGVSVLTLANVGHMLCGAVTDPFRGPYYRMIGIAHQFLATALTGVIVSSLTSLADLVRGQPAQCSYSAGVTNVSTSSDDPKRD